MKRISFLIAFASLMLLSFGLAHGVTEIVLDNDIPVTGYLGGDSVYADSAVRWNFRLRFTDLPDTTLAGLTNGFRVWTHSSGAYTDNFSAITYDTFEWGWKDLYDLVFKIKIFSIDGVGADSVSFGGTRLSNPGVLNGTDSLCWWIETTPTTNGDTLCIDSAFCPTGDVWMWVKRPGNVNFFPDWGGPYCFHVYDPLTDVKEVESPDLPTTYSLSQNYPNPFNPNTEIKFDILVRSHVTLIVYNVLGQKVTTLVDKEMLPGSYVADWNSTSDNGKEVTSGVYFYKLEADDFIQTKKMLLLK
jgi:hypothetical protein